jgi:hypothetical protein
MAFSEIFYHIFCRLGNELQAFNGLVKLCPNDTAQTKDNELILCAHRVFAIKLAAIFNRIEK